MVTLAESRSAVPGRARFSPGRQARVFSDTAASVTLQSEFGS